MFESIKKLNELLNHKERRSFFILIGVILFDAVLEMASIAIIPIYITVVAFPEKIINKLDNYGISYPLIGYVPQMIYLVDGSIKENIALGCRKNEINEQALQ